MEEQQRGIALVILGIVAVIAVVGLVLMFSGAKKSAGAVFTSATGGDYVCPISTKIGEPQWFPVLAGPWENAAFLKQWTDAGYECVPAINKNAIDEYGYGNVGETKGMYCCRNPIIGQEGINPQVYDRGNVPLTTRQGAGIAVGSTYQGNFQYAAPADWKKDPRIGP